MNIQDTIRRSLAAAGIDDRSALSARVLGTIESALDQAFRREPGASQDDRPPPPRTAHGGVPPTAATPADEPGSFERRTLPGGHVYWLYVPASCTGAPAPLVLMLHGCTQGPEDFARGTGMNARAEAQGVLVAYPEQPANANGSRCWNWFRPQDQQAGGGEPAWLAGVVDDVARRHPLQSGRVFVAGLSAGAAMAVILGETHPDVFAAVGAHSGLPYGAATDVPSAFAVMKSGAPPSPGVRRRPSAIRRLITFHGDADGTVSPANTQALVAEVVSAHRADLLQEVEPHRSPQGGGHSLTRYSASGHAVVEQWTVHGAGHAWSGGRAEGSYTDPAGPDASSAMLRFFLEGPA